MRTLVYLEWVVSKRLHVIRAVAVAFPCCVAACTVRCERVLLVSTESATPPQHICPPYTGECVATDLASAGIPFDVATYGRFVQMDLSGYDVIVLSGHTTPTPVADVAAKCQSAIQQGHKIFINGHWPFLRFDPTISDKEVLVEHNRFCYSLFNVTNLGAKALTGIPSIPLSIQKDPAVTALGCNLAGFYIFGCPTEPSMRITVAGYTIGFLYPQGGLIDSLDDYGLALLDYGKVVNWLRYGDALMPGFANDRIGGKPIVSIEVHHDRSNNLAAIDAIDALSRDFQIPLVNLLVYDRLTPESIAKYNSITNPLMTFGGHSRTHPWDWNLVTNVDYEVYEAIQLQKQVIPRTEDFFNFSGLQNPTRAQLERVWSQGVAFPGAGADGRAVKLRSGQYFFIQTVPINRGQLGRYGASTIVPLHLSHTMQDDIYTSNTGRDYFEETKKNFAANVKYGIYTFGYIHDTVFDPASVYAARGVPGQIRQAMEYLRSQEVEFISTQTLVARLLDYFAGSIQYSGNPDGTADITVTRPNALANEIKIPCKGDLVPYATGASVVSQRLAKGYLYVTLRPETSSVIHVEWSVSPVPPPSVLASPFISNASEVQWVNEDPAAYQHEFQYAVGTAPAEDDALSWTYVGTANSVGLNNAQLQHLQTYYVSVKSRRLGGSWGAPGVSGPLVADLTAPARGPRIIDDGEIQVSTTSIHATWTADDPESGIIDYSYAIGSQPGSDDLRPWTLTTATEVVVDNLNLEPGHTDYVSARARNGAGLWSPLSTSDGIYIVSGNATIGLARQSPDMTPVYLRGNVVTAVFSNEFYIQSLDRSAGIKVVSSATVKPGDVVDVTGKVSRNSVERIIVDANVSVVSSATVKPVFMTNLTLGGSDGSAVYGATSGIGLNNVGLLVKTFGRITEVGPGYIYINDGSDINPGQRCQVKVLLPETGSYDVGSYVFVTGISTLDLEGVIYKRMIRPRNQSDIVVIIS